MKPAPKWPISSNDVDDLLRAIRPLRIAVIGDFCLDVYLTINSSVSEISVETGLQTRPVSEQRYSLGGAGNVAANLAALECSEVCALGVIGVDPFGEEMARILQRAGINSTGIVRQQSEWDTCAYTKVLETDGEECRESNRIDYGNFNRLRPETADRLTTHLSNMLDSSTIDAVIINQQLRNGIHTTRLQHSLQTLVRLHPNTMWVTDSRDFSPIYSGTVLKITETEAANIARMEKSVDGPIGSTTETAYELFSRRKKPVFITRDNRGCITCGQTGIIDTPSITFLDEIDPVGAGDAFLAGITTALAAGSNTGPAAAFGSLTAGVTVTKLNQTGTATPSEISALARDAIYQSTQT